MPVRPCALDPKDRFAYENLSGAYEHLGRYDEARAILDQSSARKLSTPSDSGYRFALAFLRGDEAGMQSAVDAAKGSSFEPIMFLYKWEQSVLLSGRYRMRAKLLAGGNSGAKRRHKGALRHRETIRRLLRG